MEKINYAELAADLVNGTPMAFKAYPDGSLVVIGPDGRKFCFSALQVEQAQARLAASAIPRKPSRSSQAKNQSGKTGVKSTAPSKKNASAPADSKS
jgi:hypothetical protein